MAFQKRWLDIVAGYRGILAVYVCAFHYFCTYWHTIPPVFYWNHAGCLVDFFYLISGFSVGYSNAGKKEKIRPFPFLKRRLLRLYPMIWYGMFLGVALFYFSSSPNLPLPQACDVPLWKVICSAMFSALFIATPSCLDVRGLHGMCPLNEPFWFEFFDIIGNVLFAFIFNHLNSVLLSTLCVCLWACFTTLCFYCPLKSVNFGFYLTDAFQVFGGLVRMAAPFTLGILIARWYVKAQQDADEGKRKALPKPRFALPLFAATVLFFTTRGRFGTDTNITPNVLYEIGVDCILFPLLLVLGIFSSPSSEAEKKLCEFLGTISYPLYASHHPVTYIFTAYVFTTAKPLAETWQWMIPGFVLQLLLALVGAYWVEKPAQKMIKTWLDKTRKEEKPTDREKTKKK